MADHKPQAVWDLPILPDCLDHSPLEAGLGWAGTSSHVPSITATTPDTVTEAAGQDRLWDLCNGGATQAFGVEA